MSGLAKFGDAGSTDYNELVAGATVTVSGVLLTGQGVLARGTILGKDGATGKWSRVAAPPAGILVHETDTSAGDVVSIIHVQGKYKDNAIVLPDGKTLAETRAALWDTGVYLLDVQE